ncbi:esterase E4-like [Hetaerina americana]|uniref:esterase E4-like n=1 Tax=Hetaerina americana TaxID=62018 RepID=UPI003A7F3B09
MDFPLLFLFVLIFGTNSYCEVFNDSDEKIDSSKLTGPVVQLSNGYIRGKTTKTWSGKAMYSFLGIRYAQPPLGELQFKAPIEWSESWPDVKNMHFDGNKCPQLTFPERKFQGDEDCLFLNVYVSKLVSDETQAAEKLKVFFFLHGGGFTFGSGISEEYGPQFLLEHDMILVIPNYRLGPYGFLSMGDDILPGNLGLLDQQLALKWVKNNIAAFGGDPDHVTLGGSQAGAISAHIHALTPSSHGLFTKAIALTGNALTSWGVVDSEDAKRRALRLGEHLDCRPGKKNKQNSELSSIELLSCIAEKDVESVIWKSQFVLDFNTDFTFPFVPVVSSTEKQLFLNKHPKQLLAEGAFADIPWIVGVTSLVGLPHALQIMMFPRVSQALSESLETSLPVFLDLWSENEENIIEAGRRIKEFYSLEAHSGFEALQVLGKVFSDFYYFNTLIDTIKAYTSRNSAPVYAYHFSYNYRLRRKIGVPQGDDIAHLFPGTHYIMKLKSEDSENEIIKMMTEIIASFMNTGNPATVATSRKLPWDPVKVESLRFIDIGQKSNKMMNETGLCIIGLHNFDPFDARGRGINQKNDFYDKGLCLLDVAIRRSSNYSKCKNDAGQNKSIIYLGPKEEEVIEDKDNYCSELDCRDIDVDVTNNHVNRRDLVH